jgi:Phage gp6-like head-tail connector protein
MASIKVSDRDEAVLPAALLDIAKKHCRVEHDDDDDYLALTIARAIAWFEAKTDTLLNPVTIEWKPGAADFCNGKATVPETPVADDWIVAVGAEDTTANYQLTTMSAKGVGLYALEGAFASGMVMTFQSGFEEDAVPAGIVNVLLLYTAHLYENREVLVPGAQVETPGWLFDVLAPWWKPRV